MNTELISKMREIHALVIGGEAKEIIGRGADALEAAQTHIDRLIDSYNMGTQNYRALEKERDAALARLAEIEAGASPQPDSDLLTRLELMTAEREACLQDCAGWTTLQRPDVNDGKPWQTQNDPSGYCRAAIKERSAK